MSYLVVAPILPGPSLDRIVESWTIVLPAKCRQQSAGPAKCRPTKLTMQSCKSCIWVAMRFYSANPEICSIWLELDNECSAVMSRSGRQWELSDQIDTADCLVDWLGHADSWLRSTACILWIFKTKFLQILQIAQWICIVEKIEFWQQIQVLAGMSLGEQRHP